MTDSNFYIVLKLTSGEQVMAVLREEDDEHILLEDPMCIRMIPIMNQNREAVTAHPLCNFSDDHTFVIPKKNVLFIKRLHQVFIPHYLKIVQEHSKSSFLSNSNEEPLWEEEEMTPERARKAISMLNNIMGEKQEEEVDWEEKLKNLVPGNDTIN